MQIAGQRRELEIYLIDDEILSRENAESRHSNGRGADGGRCRVEKCPALGIERRNAVADRNGCPHEHDTDTPSHRHSRQPDSNDVRISTAVRRSRVLLHCQKREEPCDCDDRADQQRRSVFSRDPYLEREANQTNEKTDWIVEAQEPVKVHTS